MVWEKTRPDGSRKVNLSDDDLRENNDALETGLNTEHVLVTGGAQHLRHRFGRGTGTARDLIVDWVEGSLWINTSRITGEEVIDWYDGAAWVETTFALSDIGQDWSGLQVGAAYYDLNAGAGGGDYDAVSTPGEVNIDWDDGNFQKVTISKNSKLMNGLNKPSANKAADMRLVVTQDGSGAHTLDLGTESDYVFGFGVEPLISTGASEVNVLVLSILPSGSVLVSAVTNVS